MNLKRTNLSPLIEKFCNQVSTGKALDLGSGQGNNAIFLAEQGFSVTAVDTKQTALDILEKSAKENNVNLQIINKDIKDFAIEEDQYSFISAMNCLNFFSRKDFISIIGKIKSGLKKNGICVITLFTNNDSLFGEIKEKTTTGDDGTLKNEVGKKWYFLKPNELEEFFKKEFTILFYIETAVEDKRGHPGNTQPHKHEVARIVAKKKLEALT